MHGWGNNLWAGQSIEAPGKPKTAFPARFAAASIPIREFRLVSIEVNGRRGSGVFHRGASGVYRTNPKSIYLANQYSSRSPSIG